MSALESAAASLAAMDGPVFVACSGGLDSTALTALAATAGGGEVGVLHVNPQLGAPADPLAPAARATAARLSLPFATLRVDVDPAHPGGLEAAAREARYAAIARLTPRTATVLSAHTADDRVETMLLRLGQGAGLRGLEGPRRTVQLAGRRIVRPLLHATRAELRAFAEAHALRWYEDPMNRDPRWRRVAIRKDVLPAWESVAPEIAAHLRSSAEQLAEDSALLRQYVDAAVTRSAAGAPGDARAISTVQQPSSAEAWRAVVAAHVAALGCRGRRGLVQEIAALAEAPAGAAVLGPGLRAERWQHRVVIASVDDPRQPLTRFQREATDLGPRPTSVGSWALTADTACAPDRGPLEPCERFDADAVRGPLIAEAACLDAPFVAFGHERARPVGAWLRSDGWNAFQRDTAVWVRDAAGPLWLVGGRRAARGALSDTAATSDACLTLSAAPRA